MDSARWTAVFDYGSGRVSISAEARANLMDGLDGLFSGFPAGTLNLMQQGFAVPGEPSVSLTEIWEAILSPDISVLRYFEGAIPLVDDREWFRCIPDALREHVDIATFHTGVFRPRFDVIYMWPAGYQTALMYERPLGLTQYGYVYHGRVSYSLNRGLCFDIHVLTTVGYVLVMSLKLVMSVN
jgi:hypothetical protein